MVVKHIVCECQLNLSIAQKLTLLTQLFMQKAILRGGSQRGIHQPCPLSKLMYPATRHSEWKKFYMKTCSN